MSKRNIFISTVVLLEILTSTIMLNGCNDERSFKTQDSLENFTSFLNSKIPGLVDDYNVPGLCIAIIKKGEHVWSNAYGYADLQQNKKMSVDAVFRVESISKSVTAWGVMKLVEKGLLGLDAPVEKYLDDWELLESEFFVKEITVRKLLSHNSGLSLGSIGIEYSPEDKMPSLRDYLSKEIQLESDPSMGFSYSNTGYNLLELIIEEVTGESFSEFMRKEILLPLGMSKSMFVWDESISSKLPTGYDLKGTPIAAYVYPAKASGGLFAPINDIARFVAAGMHKNKINTKVLMQKNITELYSSRVKIPGIFSVVADEYGYGHFIETLPDGRRAVWHGGQGHGWMSHFHSVPASGDGIVILTNSQRSWPMIAQILNYWSEWSSLGSVKMERIRFGIIVIRFLLLGLVLFSLFYLSFLTYELRRGKRVFTPFVKNSLWSRSLKAFVSLNLIGVLVWSAAQPYLIISSIFPDLSVWAGYSLLAFAIVLFISSLLPSVEN